MKGTQDLLSTKEKTYIGLLPMDERDVDRANPDPVLSLIGHEQSVFGTRDRHAPAGKLLKGAKA